MKPASGSRDKQSLSAIGCDPEQSGTPAGNSQPGACSCEQISTDTRGTAGLSSRNEVGGYRHCKNLSADSQTRDNVVEYAETKR